MKNRFSIPMTISLTDTKLAQKPTRANARPSNREQDSKYGTSGTARVANSHMKADNHKQ